MNDQQRIETAADNCEVLRARLARYEDGDGNPKAQPSGVVLPPHCTDRAIPVKYRKGWNCCISEVARLNSSPVSAGEYGDAYQGAREDLAIWKRRALEAESKIREQDQIIDNLGNALNDENGPTFMGEPVIRAGGVDERAAIHQLAFELGGTEGGEYWLDAEDMDKVIDAAWQARAALSAPSHGDQVRDGWKWVPVEPTHEMLGAALMNQVECLDAIAVIRTDYKAMLAAAPSAGSQKEQE